VIPAREKNANKKDKKKKIFKFCCCFEISIFTAGEWARKSPTSTLFQMSQALAVIKSRKEIEEKTKQRREKE
jgi:hypothetical protein